MNRDANGNPIHRPEYVILDAEESEDKRGEQREAFQTLENVGSKKYPWSMHIVALILLFVVCLATALVFFFLLATALLACLTLFQSPFYVGWFQTSWKVFKNSVVVLLGCMIALFSPAFGFSTIMLYTLLHKNEFGSVYFKRFFKPPF